MGFTKGPDEPAGAASSELLGLAAARVVRPCVYTWPGCCPCVCVCVCVYVSRFTANYFSDLAQAT